MLERITDHKIKMTNLSDTTTKAFFELNEDKIDLSGIQPFGGNGNIAYVNPPLFKQKTSTYCGPSSALTAIYGMGTQSKVSGSGYDGKQTTLAGSSYCNTDGSGSLVGNVTKTVNAFRPNSDKEPYEYFYAPSKNDIWYICFGSLLADKAPILHAQTSSLKYYNGHSTGHYIPVVYINVSGSNVDKFMFGVQDNNRTDKYYGNFDVTMKEVYDCMRGRYLIGVSI